MKHRGDIIRKKLKEERVNLSDLARKLNKTNRQIYNYFENPNLSADVILEIGKQIRHDLKPLFPEIFKSYEPVIAMEPEATYGVTNSQLNNTLERNMHMMLELKKSLDDLTKAIVNISSKKQPETANKNKKQTKQTRPKA